MKIDPIKVTWELRYPHALTYPGLHVVCWIVRKMPVLRDRLGPFVFRWVKWCHRYFIVAYEHQPTEMPDTEFTGVEHD